MHFKIVALASLLALSSAKPDLSQSYQAPSLPGPITPDVFPAGNFGGGGAGGGYNPPIAHVSPPKYDFNYAINAFGNDFGHQEGRDGYNTQGVYYVQLPDGRLQRVTYTVNGDSGFVAQVDYEGVAQYPAFQPSGAYSPPPSYA